MNTLLYPQSILFYISNGLYGLVILFLTYVIPGDLVLWKIKLRWIIRLPIAISIGIALWGWQGYIFGYAGIRSASYLYVIISILCWLFLSFKEKRPFPKILLFLKSNKILILIICIGIFTQIMHVLFAMNPTERGLLLCGGDSNDNIWFASVANDIKMRFPPENPGMTGYALINYHYWSNLVVADISRVFGIPLYFVQFQLSGIMLSLLLGLSVIAFSTTLQLPYGYICWLLFFIYFGADAHIIVTSIITKHINFQLSSLEDGTRFLSNIPRAYAITLFFGFLTFFIELRKLHKKQWYLLMVLTLLGASLVGFKIYIAIFTYTGIVCVCMYDLLHKKYELITLLFCIFILSLIIYLPVNANAGFFYFVGLWRSRDYIVQPGLHLQNLELARVIFKNHNNIKYLLFDLLFFVLYIITTFGTKTLGLIQSKKSLSILPPYIHIFFIPALCSNFILGMFFLQSVGSSNTFNFLVNVFIIGSIYTALTLYKFTERMPIKLKVIISFLVFFATIPRTLYETYNRIFSLYNQSCNLIQNDVIESAKFVESHTDLNDRILVISRGIPFDETSPLFSILTNRPMYYSGEGLLKHFDMDYFDRSKNTQFILQTHSLPSLLKLIQKERIQYIISRRDINLTSTESATFIKQIYQNQTMQIKKTDFNSIQTYLSL
jgi:hypothetical protein